MLLGALLFVFVTCVLIVGSLLARGDVDQTSLRLMAAPGTSEGELEWAEIQRSLI